MTNVNAKGSPKSYDYEIESWGYPDPKVWRKRKLLGFALIAGAVFGLLLTVFLLARFVGDNLHAVRNDRFYRSAQMSGDEIQDTIQRYNIRTVLALRGHNKDDEEWFIEESAAVEKTDAKHVVAKLASSRLPYRSELQTLFEALDNLEEPVIVHCKHGSDRTGLVSTIWLHDYANVPFAKARKQLSFFPYLHVEFGAAAPMNEFLDQYQAYLEAHPHDKIKIRDWVKLHYFHEKEGREVEPWYDGVLYQPTGQ